MPEKNFLILLGALSVVALLWVILYDLYLRRLIRRFWRKLARRGGLRGRGRGRHRH